MKNKKNKPHFIIAGAAKAGTTALYYYLQQHPAIAFPSLKEPKYFSLDANVFPHRGPGDKSVDKYVVKSKKKYDKLFQNLPVGALVGEASPDYLYFHSDTVKKIKEELGDIPIVIVLRNPVDRAFSAYSYLKRDNREKLSFREALEVEGMRRSKNYDFIWSYKRGGEYSKQVRSFKREFTNVKVIIFEEFLENKQACMSDLFLFLKVSAYSHLDFRIRHNPSGIPTNMFAKFLLSRSNPFSTHCREMVKNIIPRSLLEKNAVKMLAKEKITQEDKEYLTAYFQKDILELEELLQYDLSLWNKEEK